MGVSRQVMRARVRGLRRNGWALGVVLVVMLAAASPGAGIPAPAFSKAFGAASIPVGGTTSLTFTITSGGGTYTGIAFSDTLPSGLAVATPNGASTTCGGTVTATAGSGSISLTGGGLPGAGSCTVVVNVVGVSAGVAVNTSGQISTNQTAPSTTATATINVDGPPTISKAFSPATIAAGATSGLTFMITNPASNPDAATGVSFSDTYPAGLVGPAGGGAFCGGTLIGTATTLTLSGATVVTGSPCSFTAIISAPTPGTFVNTTGPVSSTNGGTGGTATATLQVDPVVPVMSPWTMALVGVMLAGLAAFVIQRRRRVIL
jgi:hypothetical protein